MDLYVIYTASSASFLDLYLEFDDSGQLSTKIYDKRDDFNFKILNFPNIKKNILDIFWLLYLNTFSLYENTSLIIFSAETEYISTRYLYRNIFQTCAAIYQLLLHMVLTSRNWFDMQGPVAIILNSWNVIFIWETGYWTRAIKRFALFDLLSYIRWRKCQKYFYVTHWQKNSWHFGLLYLYTFSLYENTSLIIFSAETEYISTSYKRHLHLRNRLLDQGYKKIRLIRSLKKFIFRYK
jgi:hypothetical protein